MTDYEALLAEARAAVADDIDLARQMLGRRGGKTTLARHADLTNRLADALRDLNDGLAVARANLTRALGIAEEANNDCRRWAAGAARAWDEGYATGHSRAMRRMSDEPEAPDASNPYRKGEQA